MPEVSSPTISSPSTSGINKQQNTKTSSNSNSTSNSNTKSNNNSNTQNSSTAQSLNLSAASLLQLSNSSSSLSSLGNLNSILSGSGINSLSNTNNTSTLILNQILEQLNNIQTELSEIKKTSGNSQDNKTQNSDTKINNTNKILKFKINGINILPSITNIFFSTQDTDGSLLVSIDRTYFINTQKFDETLYLFFRNVGNNIYEVALSLTQTPQNTNSLLYKLKDYAVYESTKSTNCYLLNFSRKDLSIELLLQL